jgi:hypothetical protein
MKPFGPPWGSKYHGEKEKGKYPLTNGGLKLWTFHKVGGKRTVYNKKE